MRKHPFGSITPENQTMKRNEGDLEEHYYVDGVPSSIKAKITAFSQAAQDYAFIGSQPPEDHAEIEEEFHRARYNLELSVKTHLDRAGGGGGTG